MVVINNKMIKSFRKYLLIVLWLQMISVLQRLVFDFLGYMWLLVLFGIAAIICVIFGLFGAYQHKTKFLVAYMTWSVFWVLINFIVILLYAEVGSFSHKNDWLSLGQKNQSFFLKHGAGCKAVPGISNNVIYKNCLVKFQHVEIIQASVQVLMAIIAFCMTFRLRKMLAVAKEFYVVGNLNPQASYVKSNRAATANVRTGKPFVISSYP